MRNKYASEINMHQKEELNGLHNNSKHFDTNHQSDLAKECHGQQALKQKFLHLDFG